MQETIRLGRGRAARRAAMAALAAVVTSIGASAAVAPQAHAALAYGPYTCQQGYVWREAFPGDLVCVTPANRSAVAQENSLGPSRRSPNGGAYGPNTCRSGYVWRAARPSDLVCVPPAARDREYSNNNASVFRLEDPRAVPYGSVSSYTQMNQTGGYISASGGGISPGGVAKFYALGRGGTGAWGPYSLGQLTANANGYVSGFVGQLSCRSNQFEPATIVVVDVKSGIVKKAGTSEAVRHCG